MRFWIPQIPDRFDRPRPGLDGCRGLQTFLDHLEDLVEQTSGISQRVNELAEVLEHQTPLIWGQANEFGNGDIKCDAPDFITAVGKIISNLMETSRRFVDVWSVLGTKQFG
jgi:hypothetical protein